MDIEGITVTGDELVTRLRSYYGEDRDGYLRGSLLPQLNGWLAAGKGIAVYENQDLGHPALGELRLISFGTPEAGLEVSREELPQRLPDTPREVNWRFGLAAVYQGDQL